MHVIIGASTTRLVRLLASQDRPSGETAWNSYHAFAARLASASFGQITTSMRRAMAASETTPSYAMSQPAKDIQKSVDRIDVA